MVLFLTLIDLPSQIPNKIPKRLKKIHRSTNFSKPSSFTIKPVLSHSFSKPQYSQSSQNLRYSHLSCNPQIKEQPRRKLLPTSSYSFNVCKNSNFKDKKGNKSRRMNSYYTLLEMYDGIKKYKLDREHNKGKVVVNVGKHLNRKTVTQNTNLHKMGLKVNINHKRN